MVEELCALLVAEYSIRHILGHEEIAPDRKIDPGPAFPLDELRARLLSKPVPAVVAEVAAPSVAATVQATRLNLRAEPAASSEKVVGYLKEGTEVEIVEEKGGWCRVRVGLEGWVSKRYLDKT